MSRTGPISDYRNIKGMKVRNRNKDRDSNVDVDYASSIKYK